MSVRGSWQTHGAVQCFSREMATTEEHWRKVDQAAISHRQAFSSLSVFIFTAVELRKYIYSAGLAKEGKKKTESFQSKVCFVYRYFLDLHCAE